MIFVFSIWNKTTSSFDLQEDTANAEEAKSARWQNLPSPSTLRDSFIEGHRPRGLAKSWRNGRPRLLRRGNSSFTLKNGGRRANQTQRGRRKEVIQVVVETNETEDRNAIGKKIDETWTWSFEKMNSMHGAPGLLLSVSLQYLLLLQQCS